MGLLSDLAIDLDDLESLQAIIVDACNELKISPDHQGFVARVVDLHSQGHSREEILRSLRVEFARPMTIGRNIPLSTLRIVATLVSTLSCSMNNEDLVSRPQRQSDPRDHKRSFVWRR